MKKHYFVLCLIFLFSAVAVSAQGLSGKKIYIDPGHGSYGSEDRPMATIPYPMLSSTGRPETGVGFYESNTNLWKALELEQKLLAAGVPAANIKLSHTTCGGTVEGGSNAANNPSLSARAEEAQRFGADYFISIHSNAASEGSVANYLALFYRGKNGAGNDYTKGSRSRASEAWPDVFEIFDKGLEHCSSNNYTSTSPNLIGDISFKNSSSTTTIDGVSYTGYFGVLRHGIPGFLSEGFFHTYQPARHRALNKDWCRQEGVRYYRGIASYFGHPEETTGYIMGVVKNGDKTMTRSTTLNSTSWYYQAGTHDQYRPVNGAVVNLLDANGAPVMRDGTAVTYTVDNNYNGIFVFEDLVPGTYQVQVTKSGFRTLTREVSVEANATTYPQILLSEGQDNIETLSSISVGYNWNAYLTNEIKGIVRRTLQYDDNIIVLTVEDNNARTPHIYAINQRNIKVGDNEHQATIIGAVTEISTEGVIARDPNNAGDYLAISDIALTDDGKLIACNFNRTQFGPDETYVDEGYKRGTLRFYKWESLNGDPSLWVSKSTGGTSNTTNYHTANWVKADVGYTMAVHGSLDNCVLTVTAASQGQNDLRYVHITVVNNEMKSGIYTNSNTVDFLDIDHATNPQDYRLEASPLGSDHWVIDATTIQATEFTQASSNAGNPTINGSLTSASFGTRAIETNYTQRDGHHLATGPYYADNQLKGVHIYDVTNGFGAAEKVMLRDNRNSNAELELNTKFAEANVIYASATTQVEGDDVHVFLLVEHNANGSREIRLTKYSTKTAAENEAVTVAAERYIYAYGLKSTDTNRDHTSYTLNFTPNDDGQATLLLYRNGIEVYSQEIGTVTKNVESTVTINTADLLTKKDEEGKAIFAIGDELTWAIRVKNPNKVTTWKDYTIDGNLPSGTKNYHTVEIYPTSPQFGRIYLATTHDITAGNSADGVYVYQANLTRYNSSVYKGDQTTWYRTRAMAIDSKGTMYLPEFRDSHSGIFLASTGKVSGTYSQFFAGTRQTGTGHGGEFINNGVVTGASTMSTHIYGEGATTKLLVYNEDAAGTLKKNGVSIYNIGTESGNILTSWTKAPSQTYDVGLGEISGAVEGNVWGTSHGFFLALRRNLGANEEGAPALQFRDYDGNQLYNSAREVEKGIANKDLTHCEGAAFAVSRDERTLAIDRGDGTLLVYDILWTGNTPTLTLREKYTHTYGTMYQMNFDYAGNLFASGSNGLYMFAMPSTAENESTTPARSEFTITIPDPEAAEVEVEGAAIYAANLAISHTENYETYTVSFTSNENATAGYVHFYAESATLEQIEDGTAERIGSVLLNPLPKKGKNTYTIPASKIPTVGNTLIATLKWAVELKSKPLTKDKDWKQIGKIESSRITFNAVDTFPKSPNFGNIYLMDQGATGNKLSIYTPTLTNITPDDANITPVLPKAFSVASDGRVFYSDWDTSPYTFVTGPSSFTTGTAFLTGSAVKDASSVAAIYGRGEDTKLYVVSNTGGVGEKQVYRYDIGQNVTSWSNAPDGKLSDAGSGYTTSNGRITTVTYAAIIGTEKGFWVMQNCPQVDVNDANSILACLSYYDLNGVRKWQSLRKTELIKDGTTPPSMALSKDGTKLVISNSATYGNPTDVVVLDITYSSANVPTVTKNTDLTPSSNDDVSGLSTSTYSMNFDYAGNLIMSGSYGMRIYSFVKEDNTCVTPAKDAFEHRISTPKSETPQRAIFAYDLHVQGATSEPEAGEVFIQPDPATNTYTFTFQANTDATKAELIFYADAACTEEKGRVLIPYVTIGYNAITLSADTLPELTTGLHWGIELTAPDVTEWGILHEENRGGETGVVAVNINPQTDAFGRIYTYFRNSTDPEQAGSFIYDPLDNGVKNPPAERSDITWGRLARMGMNQNGDVFFTDKSSTNPGIFIGKVNPDNKDEMPIYRFFQGENGEALTITTETDPGEAVPADEPDRNVYAIIKNSNDVEVGSAIMAVDTYAKEVNGEKHAILFAYAKGHSVPWGANRHKPTGDGGQGISPTIATQLNQKAYEDYYRSNLYREYAQADATAGFIPYHSILEYDLGRLDGPDGLKGLDTIWNKAPTRVHVIGSNNHVAQTANLWATSKGLFISHERELNNNTDWAASLLFYDGTGEQYNSGSTSEPTKELITGSTGGAMAVTADEKTLILQNASQQFLVFDITWTGSKPTLTLRAIYTHGQQEVNQMAFDYAGNLIATGANGMTVFAIPDPNNPTNCHFTPARTRLKVILNDPAYDRIFIGGDTEKPKAWSVKNNWENKVIPVKENRVLIKAPCEVDVTDAVARSIDIMKPTTGDAITLSVLPAQALTVQEKILQVGQGEIHGYTQGTHTTQTWEDIPRASLLNENLLFIRSAEAGQGILIQHDSIGQTKATVELYGQYTKSPELKWQYMGVPFPREEAADWFYGSWMYQWDEPTSTWQMLAGRGHGLELFRGYILTHDENDQHRTHVMKGTLQPSTRQEIELTKEGVTRSFVGANFLANSWTAPIRIEDFADSNFVNVQQTIYLYDSDNHQYNTYPTQTSEETVIHPLQGFFVLTDRTKTEAAKLILNYGQLISPPAEEEYIVTSEPESDVEPEAAPAPARVPRASAKHERMKITITGDNGYYDDIRLYQHENYTSLFDNGYDGRKMEGDATVPYFTATTTDGEMAVLATPNYYGTMLNFRKGEAQEYTVTFEYDNPDETWMLEDLIAHTSVEIRSGNKYWFTTNDADIRTRFRISRRGEENDGVLLPPSVWVANGQLYLENPTDEPVDVRVYTVDGKLVQHVKTGDLITPLKVPIRGLYIIQITHTNSVQTVKQLL